MVDGVIDHVVDEARALPAREVGLEARPQVVDGRAARAEARQGAGRPLEAELCEEEQLVRVLACGEEALDHEVAEAGEGGRARAWLGLGLGLG